MELNEIEQELLSMLSAMPADMKSPEERIKELDLDLGGKDLSYLLDYDVFFGAVGMNDRELYASLVRSWLLCLAYGAEIDPSRLKFFPVYPGGRIFCLDELKYPDRYGFILCHGNDGIYISVYDRESYWEVLRIEM